MDWPFYVQTAGLVLLVIGFLIQQATIRRQAEDLDIALAMNQSQANRIKEMEAAIADYFGGRNDPD